MIVKGLHIEPTNICTLKCPRCARTTFIEKFKQKSWINTNLDLSALKSFLDIPLRNVTVTLCGNYGDPIYYEHLFDLIQFIKQQCGIVVLVTNGSYNKQDWWVKLTSFLSSEDKIIFSVDGVPENLTMYRKNADWQSILAAMKIVASSSIYSSWKYIPFSFNINTIEQAKNICQDIGIKNFEITPSDRWEGDSDPLMPIDSSYIGPRINKINFWKNKDPREIEIEPKCQNGDQHFITSDGFYTPCCYANDWRFYYKSDFYKNRNKYNIRTTTISKVLNINKEFFSSIKIIKPEFCTFNCPKINNE